MADIQQFLNDVPSRVALCALSVAESLTDNIAKEICVFLSIKDLSPTSFIFALRQCDVVIPRNREWSFSRGFRSSLHQIAKIKSVDTKRIHKFLLDQSFKSRDDLPAYLYTKAGRAYHRAGIGQVPQSLKIYSEIANGPPSGEQWLAGILAEEQQKEQILPANAIEPGFLRGMSLYNERDLEQAETYLAKVAKSSERRIEVAVALHIVGILAIRQGDLRKGLELFDRSVSMTEYLGDKVALAMVLTSRASAKRNLRDPEGALEDLTHVINLNIDFTKSHVLNLRASVKRDLDDIDGALDDLSQAAAIGEEITYAMVLNSRSLILRDLGDIEGAIKVVGEMSNLSSDVIRGTIGAEALENRQTSLMAQRKRLSNAVSDIDKKKLLLQFLLNVAKNYLRNYSDLYRAIGLLRRIMTMDDSGEFSARCLDYLGRAYLKLDKFHEAIKCFELAISGGEKGSELLASYAFSLQQVEVSLETTRALFESAIRKNHKNAWAESWFALALSAEGYHSDAEFHARKAVAAVNQNPIILFNLARVLDAMEDSRKKKEAIEVAKESVKFSRPTFTAAKQFLIDRNISIF